MNGKILTSILVIGVVTVLVGGATFAYFYDTETSVGNTFAAGTLDLTVDGEDDPLPVKFNFTSLAPCSNGTVTWVLENVGSLDGFIDISNVTVVNAPGITTEPEPLPDSGELGANMNVTMVLGGGVVIYTGTLDGMAATLYNLNYELAAGETINLTLTWYIPTTVSNVIQGDVATVGLTINLNQIADEDLINSGFDTGDLTGWSVNYPDLVDVVDTYTSSGGNTSDNEIVYEPKDGDKFVVLHAGAGEGVYTTVSQTVFLEAGQGLAGWAAFDAKDYLPFDDDSAVVIISGSPLETPWSKNISDVGDWGESDWESWSWTAPADGYYTLELKVANQGDNYFPSSALFDAIVIYVPEGED